MNRLHSYLQHTHIHNILPLIPIQQVPLRTKTLQKPVPHLSFRPPLQWPVIYPTSTFTKDRKRRRKKKGEQTLNLRPQALAGLPAARESPTNRTSSTNVKKHKSISAVVNNWNTPLSHLSFRLILHNVPSTQISRWPPKGCIYFYACQASGAKKQCLPSNNYFLIML